MQVEPRPWLPSFENPHGTCEDHTETLISPCAIGSEACPAYKTPHLEQDFQVGGDSEHPILGHDA
jgi:hypothetical protein